MARRKKVLAVRTKYSKITVHKELLDYITDRINNGLAATIYENPHILTAFYDDGTTAKIALSDAIDAYKLSKIKANLDEIEDKMALAVEWLDGFTDQVENIANDPANSSTREEAATNIAKSGLTPEKLVVKKKVKPQTPTYTAKVAAGAAGIADIVVTNIDNFDPTMIVFVIVEIPTDPDKVIAPAIVELIDGQITVTCDAPVMMITISITGKGRKSKVKKLKTGRNYNVYGYTRNGKLLISDLSDPVLLTM